ncbi:hypothetical protein [Bacillus sp. JJ722]|uniref:hypothetical protein n=1 Tax=Bacillus sp. JJ722 TaxID=3122973 RepID=UPI002FFDB50C
MKKVVYEIDKDGFIVESYVFDFDKEGNPLQEVPGNIIIETLPDGMFKPKWDGAKWIEGATQLEIEEITKPKPIQPSTEDYLLDLDYRLSAIEIGLGGI